MLLSKLMIDGFTDSSSSGPARFLILSEQRGYASKDLFTMFVWFVVLSVS